MQRKDSSSALKASGDGAGVTAAKKQDDSESREGGNTHLGLQVNKSEPVTGLFSVI